MLKGNSKRNKGEEGFIFLIGLAVIAVLATLAAAGVMCGG